MAVKSIPINLLIHSCEYKKWDGTSDRNGQKNFTSYTLKKVRLEVPKKTSLTSLGEMKADKYLLFFDQRNSRIYDSEDNQVSIDDKFNEGDEIIFGETLTIRESEPLYADTPYIHHWEVYLT